MPTSLNFILIPNAHLDRPRFLDFKGFFGGIEGGVKCLFINRAVKPRHLWRGYEAHCFYINYLTNVTYCISLQSR